MADIILGATCGCGRTISIPCATVADIREARAKMVGWGYDAHGRVQCPSCLGGAAEPVPAGPAQLPLFGGEVAQ